MRNGNGRLLFHLALLFKFVISRINALCTTPKLPKARAREPELNSIPFEYNDIKIMNEPPAYVRPKPAVVFFDCDDCLYFDDWRIAGHLTTKIEDHCQKEFGLPKGYAYTLYKKHGTALRGLIAEGYLSRDCSASMDGFLDKVHDLPIHELLSPDAQLRDMVSRIHPSIRKFVFTASVSHHAQRCLEALGIADLIEGIIDVKDCQFETKHSMSSFKAAMEKAGVDNPEACVFLDDSVKNIEAARKVGWRSVLVGRVGRDCGKAVTSEHAEHEIDRIHHLPEVFPELFSE